jgi:hypothetical protein
MRITNERFSIRFCHIAKNYGFKSIGSFETFLLQCDKNAKLCHAWETTRISKLLKEIEAFKYFTNQTNN